MTPPVHKGGFGKVKFLRYINWSIIIIVSIKFNISYYETMSKVVVTVIKKNCQNDDKSNFKLSIVMFQMPKMTYNRYKNYSKQFIKCQNTPKRSQKDRQKCKNCQKRYQKKNMSL